MILPVFNSRPIRVSAKANETVVIKHGLGRPVEGWVVVDIDQPARVWRSGENGRERLELMVDLDCTLSVVLL